MNKQEYIEKYNVSDEQAEILVNQYNEVAPRIEYGTGKYARKTLASVNKAVVSEKTDGDLIGDLIDGLE